MLQQVYNLRSLPNGVSVVRVDRSSKWGNPFIIGRDGGRDTVIEKYRGWLWSHMQNTEGFVESMLSELDGKHLACWCAPLPCHADILLAALKWIKEQ